MAAAHRVAAVIQVSGHLEASQLVVADAAFSTARHHHLQHRVRARRSIAGGGPRLGIRLTGCVCVWLACSTMVVVVGFAYFAQLTFGTMLVDFHSLLSSVSTLVRYPLGDFDYGDLSRVRALVQDCRVAVWLCGCVAVRLWLWLCVAMAVAVWLWLWLCDCGCDCDCGNGMCLCGCMRLATRSPRAAAFVCWQFVCRRHARRWLPSSSAPTWASCSSC